MNDLVDLHAEVQRGMRTEAFRNSEEYRSAIVAAATNIIDAFFNLDLSDEEALNLRKQFISLQAIDRQIMHVIDDGALAQAELEENEP